jgi:outer membrane protein TolC
MKRPVLFAVLALLSSLAAAPLGAQEGLTLQQVRTLAAAHSRTLQSLMLSVDSARLDEKIQSYSQLPSITASASAGIQNPAGSPAPSLTLPNVLKAATAVAVSQTVFDGTASILAAIDSLSTSIAREKGRAEYLVVFSDADFAFYGVKKAQAAAAGAQSDLDNARLHQQLAQAQLETGTITKSDLLESESRTAAKEAALAQAEGSLSVARRTLASLTGIPVEAPLADADDGGTDVLLRRFAALSASQVDTLIAELGATATRNNPSLSQSSLASQQSARRVDLARAGNLPTVAASMAGGLSYTSGAGTLSGSVTVSASISLDPWNTRAAVESESIAARQASLGLEEARRTLSLSVEQTVFDAVSSAQSVIASQKALEYAQSHYEGVRERYRLSAASSSELSDAELLLGTNRTALISARYAFLGDVSSLMTLAGFEREDLLTSRVP